MIKHDSRHHAAANNNNVGQQNYFIGESTQHGGYQQVPLAMATTTDNRCVVAWRFDDPEAFCYTSEHFILTIKVITYSPSTTDGGPPITKYGLLAYVNRNILTWSKYWEESYPRAPYDLSHICDLEAYNKVRTEWPPREQIDLRMFSHGNPGTPNHGGALRHYRLYDIFAERSGDSTRDLSFDGHPEMHFSAMESNFAKLDFSILRIISISDLQLSLRCYQMSTMAGFKSSHTTQNGAKRSFLQGASLPQRMRTFFASASSSYTLGSPKRRRIMVLMVRERWVTITTPSTIPAALLWLMDTTFAFGLSAWLILSRHASKLSGKSKRGVASKTTEWQPNSRKNIAMAMELIPTSAMLKLSLKVSNIYGTQISPEMKYYSETLIIQMSFDTITFRQGSMML